MAPAVGELAAAALAVVAAPLAVEVQVADSSVEAAEYYQQVAD